MSTTILVEALTHGRAVVQGSQSPESTRLLVGFHGYAETAEVQMARLAAIPGADAWTLLSVQGLHRFYRGRSEDVVSSWMTRQDRDVAIADNIAYVDAAIDAVIASPPRLTIVYAGFSQGVAMAFRAATLGRRTCSGVIAVGGDVPPDLVADRERRFPPVLLAAGTGDEWYTPARFDADAASLRACGTAVTPFAFDGGHEWAAGVSSAAGTFLLALQSD